MRLFTILSLAVTHLVVAQNPNPATSSEDGNAAATTGSAPDAASTEPSTSTTSQQITRTVSVGGTGHTFNPAVVQLSPGNVVEFAFYPTNHSVIRAEYKFPCIPYELTGIDKVGFDSGFRVTDAILPEPDTFRLLINDSDPIFYYCGAPGSCIDWQMVGVINPNASVSLEVQKQFAANSSFMLLPGEPFPDEADTPFPTSSSTSSETASSTGTSSGASETSSPPAAASSSSGLSSGAIAGIAIGGAAVAVALAAFLFYCGRKSRRNRGTAGPQPPMASAPPAYVPPGGGFDYHNSMQPGGMTPTMNKHMSTMSTGPVPLTDAFGNPTGQYSQPGYPAGFPPQAGYPMGTPQTAPGWPGSPVPNNDIFGQGSMAPSQDQSQFAAGAAGAELSSQRASSPGSAHAPAPAAAGGIQGFLQRQSRMSPPPQNEIHAQQTQP
ncbi:hypothetical protein B0A52_00583 [Exophiala mesophila]|uniref:Phytocyanin domain-containing protein n=1 Tax=Exophiala mesophila TaxID=212818 RepID=A0A438NHM2_EXOME|nr:hypothetical protein B0A52_00583 [Exophiala mesophila]